MNWDSVGAMHLLRNRFGISRKRFYYLKQKALTKLPLRKYFEELRRDKYVVDYIKWD